MNFLEAVRALQNGECEKIESLVTGMPFIIHEYSGGVSCGRSSKPEEILGEWRLINPRPITEEIEVKGWAIVRYDGYINGFCKTSKEAENAAKGFPTNREVIELTGHYTREVPRKVKKQIIIENAIAYAGVAGITGTDEPFKEKGATGKTGRLTFEWEE